MIRIEVSGSMDDVNKQITLEIIMAAEEAIPKGRNRVNLIQYKKAQMVRRTIRKAKRTSWRHFCDEIEGTTPVREVWEIIKRSYVI